MSRAAHLRLPSALARASLLVGALCCSVAVRVRPGQAEAGAARGDRQPDRWRRWPGSNASGKIDFPLAIAVNGGVLTVAGGDGSVLALQADSGRELWRASVGARLSAGVGSDGRRAAVVTRNGELVVLEAGRQLWRKQIGVRVHTEPLVAGERVFVLGSATAACRRSMPSMDVGCGKSSARAIP